MNIKYKLQPMLKIEEKYTFTNSRQISSQTGLIGHLRADMDTDGNGFFSSWFGFRDDLKTEKFKEEFDYIINQLRENDNFLHNRTTLANYCYGNPQFQMKDQDYYGIRINTDRYAYLLRLCPNKGEYNLYCYCYIPEWLDAHINNSKKGIRFIDPDYNELFRINDGGYISTIDSNNVISQKYCRYIDDYHVEINDNLYHICEFAEICKANHIKVSPRDKQNYTVTITNTSVSTFTISANTEEEARNIVKDIKDNGNISYQDVTYTINIEQQI